MTSLNLVGHRLVTKLSGLSVVVWLLVLPCAVWSQAGGGDEPNVTYQASGDTITANIGPVTSNYNADAGVPPGPTSTTELLPCCNSTCNPWVLTGCPPGGQCCTWGAGQPCDGPNCECYPECGLTCAVGGASCPEQCLFGPGAPIPACNALCAAITGAMMAACEAAKEAGSGAFSFMGLTVGCSSGEQITGCSPIQQACTIAGCQDCAYCTAIGLCGVKVECGDEDDITPTPTPTVQPTATSQPIATPGNPPDDPPDNPQPGPSPELFLRQ